MDGDGQMSPAPFPNPGSGADDLVLLSLDKNGHGNVDGAVVGASVLDRSGSKPKA